MGVYVVPIDLDHDRATIDRFLRSTGLAGLDAIEGTGPGFEEKLDVSPRSFDAALAGVDVAGATSSLPTPPAAEAVTSPASKADVWLPIAFSGVLTVPGVPGTYHEELRLASAVDIAARCQALATALQFPMDEVPQLEAAEYALAGWRHSLTQADTTASEVVTRDADLSFYLALYSSVAEYSIRHRAAVGYA